MTKLPDKPSELITLALKDEDKAHKSPKYQVDMAYAWHEPNGVCSVCLAGSVMAFSLNADITDSLYPKLMGKNVEDKLMALNHIRCGEIDMALRIMDIEHETIDNIGVANYPDNRTEWRKDMRGIVKLLKSKGL